MRRCGLKTDHLTAGNDSPVMKGTPPGSEVESLRKMTSGQSGMCWCRIDPVRLHGAGAIQARGDGETSLRHDFKILSSGGDSHHAKSKHQPSAFLICNFVLGVSLQKRYKNHAYR